MQLRAICLRLLLYGQQRVKLRLSYSFAMRRNEKGKQIQGLFLQMNSSVQIHISLWDGAIYVSYLHISKKCENIMMMSAWKKKK
jgi:hypothetical protein